MPAPMSLEEKKERALTRTPRTRKPTADGTGRRSAFNGTEGKLQVNGEIEGHHLYIFNDVPGRIDNALQTGYEFVAPSEVGGTTSNVVSKNTDIGGDKVRFLVGKTEDGGPMYAYLMKIKQEWWDEDQQAIQDKANMIDDAMRKGKATSNTEGFYLPTGGITIK